MQQIRINIPNQRNNLINPRHITFHLRNLTQIQQQNHKPLANLIKPTKKTIKSFFINYRKNYPKI